MGKSTHPFVEKMNEHKAYHRAMRAGEAKEAPTSHGAAEPEDMAKGGSSLAHKVKGKRTVQLTRKNAPPTKGILTAVVK